MKHLYAERYPSELNDVASAAFARPAFLHSVYLTPAGLRLDGREHRTPDHETGAVTATWIAALVGIAGPLTLFSLL